MRQFAFFALVLVLSLTIVFGETDDASGWSTPESITAIGDDTPGSLTIDPSGNWEVLYDSYDDQTNMARIKYFNSASASPVTVVEYQECDLGPACPPDTVDDFGDPTSARDETGKLHVAYGIEWAVDQTDETFYMYKDASGWSTPESITAIGDDTPGSLTIDPSGNWEVLYDSYDDQTNMVSIKYFNSGSAIPVTVVEYEECYDGPSCPPGTIAEFDGLTSARDATGKLHVVYEIDKAQDYTSEIFYMFKDASGWSTPALVAGLDDGPGSLTIDPSGNWEMVYDSYDDQTNMASIKYLNSGSASPVTVVEYQECDLGPACPPGTVDDFGDPTSARDASGTLHVAYGIEWAVDYTDETFYMYKDASSDVTIDPVQGTIGTEVDITNVSLGEKKPKILIGETKCKVITFTTSSVSCLIKKVKSTMPPGTYDVTIIRKGVLPIVLTNAFEIMAPSITAINPASGPPKAEVTITGSFFGTKKVKAYMDDGIGGKSKKGKVVSLTMDSNTGDSELVILVPKKLPAGAGYDVTVTNKVGEDTLAGSFTILP